MATGQVFWITLTCVAIISPSPGSQLQDYTDEACQVLQLLSFYFNNCCHFNEFSVTVYIYTGIIRAINITIKYRNTFEYRREYNDSCIPLVSLVHRQCFFIMTVAVRGRSHHCFVGLLVNAKMFIVHNYTYKMHAFRN